MIVDLNLVSLKNNMSNMLLYALIALVCQVTEAGNGRWMQTMFSLHQRFDDYDDHINQRLGDAPIMDTIETFYTDLKFVKAATDDIVDRDPAVLRQEIESMHELSPEGDAVRDGYPVLMNLLEFWEKRQYPNALRLVAEHEGQESFSDWIGTYFKYLSAEMRRTISRFDQSITAVLSAFVDRQTYMGISMNQLERLDGMLILAMVEAFRFRFDDIYGFTDSYGGGQLRDINSKVSHELKSMRELQKDIKESFPELNYESDGGSDGESIDTATRARHGARQFYCKQCVHYGKAEFDLYDFFSRFIIAAPTDVPKHMKSSDYSRVMDQLRELDEDFAQEFEDKVLKHIDTDIKQARKVVKEMMREEIGKPEEGPKTRRIFLAYFHTEMNLLQAEDSCSNVHKLNEILEITGYLLHDRVEHEGLSVDIVFELLGKTLLHMMECFHERVKMVYELGGDESPQELEAKHSELGAAYDRTIPKSIVMHSNPDYE